MNSNQLSKFIVDALDDGKAQDIVKLDVRDMTSVTDYMIVASGTSNRHVKSLADNIADKAREEGHKPIGVEGEDGGEWVLLDLDDVLCMSCCRKCVNSTIWRSCGRSVLLPVRRQLTGKPCTSGFWPSATGNRPGSTRLLTPIRDDSPVNGAFIWTR